jgi:putative addiction module component (TIGR02574 family)
MVVELGGLAVVDGSRASVRRYIGRSVTQSKSARELWFREADERIVEPRGLASLDATWCDSLASSRDRAVSRAIIARAAARVHIPSMAKRAVDLERLKQLPVADRLQLVEDLWDSIAEDAPDEAFPVSPELAAELERRLAEHRANPDAARPWREIRAEILGRER